MYLYGEDADAAGALRQDPVSRFERLEPVERVPRRQPGARQRGRLEKVEVRRHVHETLVAKSTILPQRAVNGAAETRPQGGLVERSANVSGVEERDDLVALPEALHILADGDDRAGAVRSGHKVALGECKAVFALARRFSMGSTGGI